MICHKCSSAVPDDSRSCPECGQVIIPPCPECGSGEAVVRLVLTEADGKGVRLTTRFRCVECKSIFVEGEQPPKRPGCPHCRYSDQVTELVREGEVIKCTDGTEFWVCHRCGGEVFETNARLENKPEDELTPAEKLELYLMKHGTSLRVSLRKEK